MGFFKDIKEIAKQRKLKFEYMKHEEVMKQYGKANNLIIPCKKLVVALVLNHVLVFYKDNFFHAPKETIDAKRVGRWLDQLKGLKVGDLIECNICLKNVVYATTCPRCKYFLCTDCLPKLMSMRSDNAILCPQCNFLIADQ